MLASMGVNHLDYFVASHYDADHIGCADEILARWPAQVAVIDRGPTNPPSTQTYARYASAVASARQTAVLGQEVVLGVGGPTLTVMAVNGNGRSLPASDQNDRGVVWRLSYGAFDALFGGDISSTMESDIVADVGQVEVYKVHHHGSRTSSSQPFVTSLRPKVATLSMGSPNSPDHPDQEVLDALRSVGAVTYWTTAGDDATAVFPHDIVVDQTFQVSVPSGGSIFRVEYLDDQDVYSSWEGPAVVPGAPTSVAGVAGNGQVTVSFSAPASTGGAAITGYTATASPGGATATGSGSPLVVAGLTNGTAYTFTVTATNSVGTGAASSPSAAVTPLAPTTTISGTPSTLRFSATKNGASGDLVSVTSAQAVTVTYAGVPAPQWTATANQTWVQITNGTGTGAGTFSVSIINPGNVIAGSTSLAATITLAASNTGTSTTVAVNLTIQQQPGQTTGPIGQVDTPTQNTTGAQGAVAITGWVVDDVGLDNVRIYRQCLPFDSPLACQTVLGASVVLVGTASVIAGARPDVEALYPTMPAANSAGWGFLILSNLFPNIATTSTAGGGVGTFLLYAVATDQEGNQTLLGRTTTDHTPTTVTVANDTIAKPFGAIDTPGQGATVSGTLNNFGWTVTPDSNTVADGTDILVPVSGTTINVIVDGASVGTATYNLCRGTVGNPVPAGILCDDDVSGIFRGAGLYRNLDAARGPIGLRTIDTTTLSNGLHTIQWGVSDSASRGEGIGSRYFNVLNSASDPMVGERESQAPAGPADKPRADIEVYGRTGFDLERAFAPVEPVNGMPTIRVPEMGRVGLRIPGAERVDLLANGEVRHAPVGVATHQAEGLVTWSVGPGYLGTYRLRIERADDHVLVDVVVEPMAIAAEPTRMQLDRADVDGAMVTLHGWALDPQAETGAGIGAVHVWARQRGVDGAQPLFLGAAELGVARPDVAAAHGDRFPSAGFGFTGVLPEGEWEISAYVWAARTGRFEDARSVTVIIR
jgi:beta-lactamase superfamily II metal-dependent hydrolase